MFLDMRCWKKGRRISVALFAVELPGGEGSVTEDTMFMQVSINIFTFDYDFLFSLQDRSRGCVRKSEIPSAAITSQPF